MNLIANDKSYEALTVGSLNVIGDVSGAAIQSIHTHLQTSEAGRVKIQADMERLYQSISSDGIISVNEKLLLKKEMTIIESEYPVILNKAEKSKKKAEDIASYKTSYTALIRYIYTDLKLFDDMKRGAEIERDVFNAKFADYYNSVAVLQIASDSGKPLSFPADSDSVVFFVFDEAPQAAPTPNPSFTAWQSRTIAYDCTGKSQIKMTFAEALHNVIILSGELSNDFNLQLFFDSANGNGAKQYVIIYKLTGNFAVTIETGLSGKNKISQGINADTFGLGCYAVVDFNGNVWHFKGEKGQGGSLHNLDIAGYFDDENYFLIETENEIKKLKKDDGLLAIQKYDSPVGEVRVFYEEEYKHGFLEANGLPFSPDVFPEFAAYVKRVFNVQEENFVGWPYRPKIIKNDGTYIFLKAVQGV